MRLKPAANWQKAYERVQFSIRHKHDTLADLEWNFKTANNMGTKCMGLILVLLFVSSAMAFLGNIEHGKRDLTQKVGTSLTSHLLLSHFDSAVHTLNVRRPRWKFWRLTASVPLYCCTLYYVCIYRVHHMYIYRKILKKIIEVMSFYQPLFELN